MKSSLAPYYLNTTIKYIKWYQNSKMSKNNDNVDIADTHSPPSYRPNGQQSKQPG